MSEEQKTFQQTVSSLNLEGEGIVARRVKTTVYLPGLISEDGKASIKELVLLALAAAFAKHTIAEKDGEIDTAEESNKLIDREIEDIRELFSKAAYIEAMRYLHYALEHRDEVFEQIKDIVGLNAEDGDND